MRIMRCIAGILWMAGLSVAQTTPSIPSLPGTLERQNFPRSWHMDSLNALTISSDAKTDWFVDPFDGTVAENAPMLLFTPGPDYVLSTRVRVKFATKWDAGALMLWRDNHHWAKLSFELSPDGRPTLVTVVTRGVSDDCNSMQIRGDSVHLRIAKNDKTYVFYVSTDGTKWQILRTFSLDTDLPVRVGFESQSPAGLGVIVSFSAFTTSPVESEMSRSNPRVLVLTEADLLMLADWSNVPTSQSGGTASRPSPRYGCLDYDSNVVPYRDAMLGRADYECRQTSSSCFLRSG